jgi:fatty-acid desaturase
VDSSSDPRRDDVVDKALGTLDHLLDVVHDKVLRPIMLAGRAIAFSAILVLMSIVLVAMLIIGFVRLLDVYAFASHQWLSYLLVGAISLAAGLVIWRRRHPVRLRK